MSKPIRFVCAAALFFGVGATHAFTPSRGVWWNPNEGGRGYELDRQGAIMTLGIYAYDADGNATWYLGAGNYDPINNAFQGEFDSFSGGQCFGCAYSSPVNIPFGTVSIQFSDAEHGVLSYPGGSVPIEHFITAMRRSRTACSATGRSAPPLPMETSSDRKHSASS
jgi:hypothetical protein